MRYALTHVVRVVSLPWEVSTGLESPALCTKGLGFKGLRVQFKLSVQLECSNVMCCVSKLTPEFKESTDGSYIETKESSLVWNYRDADPDFGSWQAKELLDHLEGVLSNQAVEIVGGGGHAVVEVRPQGVSKGRAVEKLLAGLAASKVAAGEAERRADFILCIGDDRSDEDMFVAIETARATPRMVADIFECTVGQKPSRAPFYLNDPAEVLQLMSRLNMVHLYSSPRKLMAVMCIEYRALNAQTLKDKGPLPRLADDLFNQLQGAKYFTSLDLWSGYHQCRIHPDDMHKTAFKTRYGLYEFTVMPFGLTIAPAAFMRLMHDVLKPFIDKFVIYYLDDVLIYSKTEQEHLQHLEAVLRAFEQHNLKVKLSKCSFAQPSTRFLGFQVSSLGLLVDPKKVHAVVDWPLPKDLTAVRPFLGFVGFYRCFIKGFATIAAPLSNLTKTTTKPFPVELPTAKIDAFHQLKAALCTAPVLIIPNNTGPDSEFELRTDASGIDIGAVL
ncbi:hypothetical protein CEUSTIGMA_g9392.t1 [Chlamydomonas eustigma]|uniref:Trehalose 6-phosphate phosphatase n=1 Tax=Chlamydomonas eustigma TaxID=1157962 RepID=A0A250XFV8_9CHLO|nr:hypothetical protein CEUSTIGMA_g9392.t1 [Chlamydomonas eustigma]|eukprot:GAX81964.1 hypothetical protein CEUSTIGMA_g9392.t1 [Chlamydomonas eustigma]